MEVRAYLRDARMSSQKVRALRPLVLGLPVVDAQARLSFAAGKASDILYKVLRSAVANAKSNFELEEDKLIVGDVVVGDGIKFKRFRPVSRGMAHPYQRRTSHVTVVVREAQEGTTSGTKRSRRKRAADIETLSVEELAASAAPTESVDTSSAPDTSASDVPRGDKELDAHQIKKMHQGGGDRKKTHRRKSI